MKIAIVGTHGIPAKYGGFETFAQEVSQRLIKMGIEVEVYCNKDYEKNGLTELNGVNLRFSKYNKGASSIESVKYYNDSIKMSIKDNCDIVLSCGCGGALEIMCQHFKKRHSIIITNTDGIEHRRTKKNWLVRNFISKPIEFFAVHFSDHLIADSEGIESYLYQTYPCSKNKTSMIEYGAYIKTIADNHVGIEKEYGLKPHMYYLVVARLEKENNVSMIVDGYLKSHTDKKLVIVGNLDSRSYVEELLKRKSGSVIFTDGIYDQNKLEALRLNCYAYLHGHSVGGTNPSLLEALGCGNIVIGHDNKFVREVTDNHMFYFANEIECAERIDEVDNISIEKYNELQESARRRIQNYYNWQRITEEYLKLFQDIIN